MGSQSKLITYGNIIDGFERSSHVGLASALYNEAISEIDYDKLAEELQEFAREGHRGLGGRHYKDRSENLRDNTYAKAFKRKDKGSIAVGYNGSATMNNGFNYGRWIRGGARSTWEGDDFVQETIDNKDEIISKFFQRELDKGVARTNSRSHSVPMGRSINAILNFIRKIWRSV